MTQNGNFIHHLNLSKTEIRLDLISSVCVSSIPANSDAKSTTNPALKVEPEKVFCEGRFKMLPWAMRGAERVWAPLAVFTMQTQLLSPGQGGI